MTRPDSDLAAMQDAAQSAGASYHDGDAYMSGVEEAMVWARGRGTSDGIRNLLDHYVAADITDEDEDEDDPHDGDGNRLTPA